MSYQLQLLNAIAAFSMRISCSFGLRRRDLGPAAAFGGSLAFRSAVDGARTSSAGARSLASVDPRALMKLPEWGAS